MANYYWQRRVYDQFSPKFQKGSPLQALSNRYFEDFCICNQDPESGLCLRTFGIRHSYPEYQDLHRVSSRFHLYCVLAGKGYANGKLIQEGDLILFDRNKPYNVSADLNDPFIYTWITFKGENVEKHLNLIGLKEGHQIYRFDNLQEICALFYDILYVDHDTCNTALYLESRLMLLLSMLQNLVPASEIGPTVKRCNKHTRDAVEYLRKNCSRQDFRVNEVSEALGMNEKYLRRLFLKEMQMSMRDYITDFRIHTAKQLLKNSNYNISEISNFVGYRDYRQFYIQFKHQTGYTPSEYAKK